MRQSLVATTLERAISVQQPIMIWGPPGAGKSATTEQVAKNTNRKLIDLRLSLLDPVDLRGFPHLINNEMHFAKPAFLPTKATGPSLLFLDEINAAPPATQAAAYQLVLNRRIGEYELPDDCAVVAAGNRETDRGVTFTMPAPLANRFCHIEYEVQMDDWRQWAMRAGIGTEIINFISFRPGLLMDFDPDKRAFPTPRSWEFVSRILSAGTSLEPEVERAMIAGSVGDGAAAEFAGFLKIYRNLPNPDAVLMDPKAAKVPTDPATLYALCGALSERASEANFERLVEYADRIKPEFQVLLIRDSVSRKPELSEMKVFGDWAGKNASVLI